MKTNGISFNASLNRITSTIDGGWRVTFDVPQSDAEPLLMIAALREEALRVIILTAKIIADYNDIVTNGEEHA